MLSNVALTQETQASTKQKKVASREGAALMQRFDKAAESTSPDKGNGSGTSAPPSVVPSDVDQQSVLGDDDDSKARPKRSKDLVRVRANMFEKNKKLVAACEADNESALVLSQKVCDDHTAERDSMQHFFDILKVRTELLRLVTEKSQDELKSFVEKTSKESLSYQPVPIDHLETTLTLAGLNTLVNKILATCTQDELDAAGNEAKNMLAIHAQIRSAVRTSTKDIENAVKSKKKRIEATAKKAAQNAAKEKEKNEKAAAAAKALPVGAVSGAKATLLGVGLESFTTKVKTFATFEDFKSACPISSEEPFLINQFDPMLAFLKDNVALKCQLVNFGNQFLGTQICKQTGRAQCPVMGDDSQKSLGVLFNQAVDTFVIPMPSGADTPQDKILKPVVHTALFGFAADMEYAGVEDKALGQLRFVHAGTRKVCLMKPTGFRQHLSAKPAENMGELVQAWKFVRFEDLQQKKVVDQVVAGIQCPGSLLYVPPAWLVAERVENGNPVVGLRQSILAKVDSSEIEELVSLLPDKHAIKVVAGAQLDLLK